MHEVFDKRNHLRLSNDYYVRMGASVTEVKLLHKELLHVVRYNSARPKNLDEVLLLSNLVEVIPFTDRCRVVVVWSGPHRSVELGQFVGNDISLEVVHGQQPHHDNDGSSRPCQDAESNFRKEAIIGLRCDDA